MWYLIHIFDRNGGDVIVFMAVVSVRESEGDAVEYGEMDWEKEEIMYIVYTNGKKFAEEQDRSLFLGVERVAGECPEHPRKALIGLSAVSA